MRAKAWAAAIALAFLVCSCAVLFTKRPWVDEAWFTTPGLNLVTHGSFGTLLLEPTGSNLRLLKPDAVLKGINEHTYWVMPLHLLVLALWGMLFGFSVFSIRVPGMLWGLITLASVGVVVRRLYPEGRNAPYIAAGVLALDFGFVNFATDGRMDIMCSALGFAGLAAYLTMRDRNFHRAVAVSHILAAAACFTHPNGAFGSAALVLAMVWLDRDRIRPATVAFMLTPYALGAALWAAYCAQAPGDFLAQISANSAGRMSSVLAPWQGVWREIHDRYLTHFWPEYSSLGKLKSTGLFLSAAAMVSVAATRALRQSTGCRLLLALTGLRFLLLALGASVKYPYYLVHILPYFAAVIGIAVSHAWPSRGAKAQLLLSGGLAAYFGVQTLVLLHETVLLRGYRNEFVPVVEYLRSNAGPGDLIDGSSEIGFGLGFYDRRLIDDVWLGYWSGKRPSLVVVDPRHYAEVIKTATLKGMPAPGYFVWQLTSQFVLVKEFRGYRIYRRRPGAASP